MATNTNRPVKPEVIQADRDVLIAILALTDYAPANAAYSKEALTAQMAAQDAAHQASVNAQNAAAAARDAEVANDNKLHQMALGAKQQAIAQYGDDSDAVQSLGLKKKSERKRPVRHAKNGQTQQKQG